MTDFNIAIIKQNKFSFDRDQLSPEGLHENLKNAISDYVLFKPVNSDTMMYEIVDTIKLEKDTIGNTSISYENDKYVFQICHLNMEDNGKKNDPETINKLASYLSLGGAEIYGDAVMICSEITDNHTCTTHDITLDDIANILNRKFVHKCVLVKANTKACKYDSYDSDDMIEISFNESPLESFDQDYKNNLRHVEVPFLKFNLIMIFEEKPKNNIINKLATRIVGDHKIFGDVIFVSKSSENEFLDLDIELFKKLLLVSEGPLSTRDLTELEKNDAVINNELPKVMNRHRILSMRVTSFTEKCNFCNVKDDNKLSLTCTGCFRVRYHNAECQKYDWNNHKLDCLFHK